MAIFSKNDFDLTLLDMMLPKISGKKVMAHIRERCLAPLLIISAKDSETDKILGLELGADDYITKPFSMGELNDEYMPCFEGPVTPMHRQRKLPYDWGGWN